MAEHLLENLFGSDMGFDDEVLLDGVGEVVNLIAGGGKRKLASSAYQFAISPPTTLLNRDPESMRVLTQAARCAWSLIVVLHPDR